eukprot:552900_1
MMQHESHETEDVLDSLQCCGIVSILSWIAVMAISIGASVHHYDCSVQTIKTIPPTEIQALFWCSIVGLTVLCVGSLLAIIYTKNSWFLALLTVIVIGIVCSSLLIDIYISTKDLNDNVNSFSSCDTNDIETSYEWYLAGLICSCIYLVSLCCALCILNNLQEVHSQPQQHQQKHQDKQDVKPVLVDITEVQSLIFQETANQTCNGQTLNDEQETEAKLLNVFIKGKHVSIIGCNVMNCVSVNQLKTLMKKYYALTNENKDEFLSAEYLENISIEQILDDYFHLLSQHNSAKDFESIYNQLEITCNISSCVMFKRNHTSRNKGNNVYTSNPVMYQILDKIHCYYAHSFDIGHRLPYHEQEYINNQENDDNKDDNTLINQQILKITQKILGKKHNLFRSIRGTTEFNKYLFQYHKNETKTDDDNSDIAYSFGYIYEYDFSSLSPLETSSQNYIGHVKPKYLQLKQEMIANPYAVMNVQQFTNELSKTKKHFNSLFGKQYITRIQQNRFSQPLPYQLVLTDLLSLMIYCNFDVIQYEFSKTYRTITHHETMQSIQQRHSYFYHLGYHLTHCVHALGETLYKGYENVSIQLYCGITQQVLFPSIGFTQIYGPLSTTSSFAVACSFAQNGLVVEFGYDTGDDVNYSSAKRFSCSWLSDYPSEQEYLFIQNGDGLYFQNIYDISTGYVFSYIMKAIQIMDYFDDKQVIVENILNPFQELLIK